MTIHSTLGRIFLHGTGWPLSPAAEKMARYMMANPNRIITKDELSDACGAPKTGRSADTYAAEIRKALAQDQPRIVTARNVGYGWIGDPIELVPIVKSQEKAARNDPIMQFAVMTQTEVGKRLGITASAVGDIERRALAKIRNRPDLKQAWKEMLTEQRKRCHYDPFHEIWLFSVAENIAYAPVEKDEDEEDSRNIRE